MNVPEPVPQPAAGEPDRAEIFSRGFQVFMGVPIRVELGVLIPRGETEILGYTAFDLVRDKRAPRLIDMCSGSGNLACALAAKLPDARVWASDLTSDCVRVIAKNIQYLSLSERVEVIQSDLFKAIPENLHGTIDLITCNPPYIPSKTLHEKKSALLELEPLEAFDAGAYGLTVIQRLLNESHPFLRDNGTLCFEFGAGQQTTIKWLFGRSTFYGPVRFVNDAAGVARVAVAHKKGS